MTSKLFGYARVSTKDQDLTVQYNELKKAGVVEALIFAEKQTGTTRDGRTELSRLLAIVGPGDIVHITKIDRLARSMHDFSAIAHDLKKRGIGLRVIQQGIDTSASGPVGELTMNMLASFAQFETEIRRERQMEGIAEAKAEGKYKGRQAAINVYEVRRLHAEGRGPSAIAKELGCSRQSVYRLLETA